MTAQNTKGVTAVSASSKDFMRAQLEAVLGDIGTDALKTGMIPSVELASVRELRLLLPSSNRAVQKLFLI